MDETEPMPSAAAGVAIFDTAGNLLLGRHAHDGMWPTFGGAVEPGASALAAALREVREEIGLDLGRADPIGTFGGSPIYTVRYADGSTQTYTVTMFARVINRKTAIIVPDSIEILEATWFTPAELSDSDVFATDMAEITPTAASWFCGNTTPPRELS